ncbi:MAG: hypothetical protein ACI8TP_003064 [Acidimicrobiales bacterium]|jgi:hypothetical protein
MSTWRSSASSIERGSVPKLIPDRPMFRYGSQMITLRSGAAAATFRAKPPNPSISPIPPGVTIRGMLAFGL